MWEDIKTNNYRYLLIVGIIVLLCAGICGWWCYESSRAKQTVMISMTDWNELKTESAAQNLELNQLRQKLIMLKMDSGEQMQQLEKLQKELEEVQISLTNANRSLNDVRNDLSESRTSLEELKNKIKKMEHKQAVIRRQRDIYAGLFVITAGAVFSRR